MDYKKDRKLSEGLLIFFSKGVDEEIGLRTKKQLEKDMAELNSTIAEFEKIVWTDEFKNEALNSLPGSEASRRCKNRWGEMKIEREGNRILVTLTGNNGAYISLLMSESGKRSPKIESVSGPAPKVVRVIKNFIWLINRSGDLPFEN
jgi:hypothetical protein